MRENYIKTIVITTIWQSLVFGIYFMVLYIERKEFLSLRTDNPKCFYFIFSNELLYIMGVLFDIIALIFSKYFKFIIRAGYCFTFILLCFTFYGVSLSSDMYKLQYIDRKYKKIYNLFIWMICIRFFFYGLICFFFGCFSVFICCALATGQ